MQKEENQPKIGEIYSGFVSNVDNLGFQVRLSNFRENYEGLLHKNLIDDNSSRKLTRGRLVRVEIIEILSNFIVISLVSVEEKMMSAGGRNKSEIVDRVIRISSPERHQVKEMSESYSDLSLTLKKPPKYLQDMKIKVDIADIFNKTLNNLFGSSSTTSETFMMRNAIEMRTQDFTDFSDYLRYTTDDMNKNWAGGEKFIDEIEKNSFNLTNDPESENPIKLWESKKTKTVIRKQRESLPIFKVRNELIKAVANNKFLIVQGETGSGKSTQIPQYLLEAGFSKDGKIVCTQPRKIATMSLAKRVAEEQGCALGAEVGYKYRFCDKTSNATVIKYCTEGVLLRECLNTTNLGAYSVVILDEAHERTTNTDVLFGMMKKEIERRPNLRVIISSATLEAKKFSKFFNDAPIFYIEGRTFPVEILYRPINIRDYFNASIATAIYIHSTQKPGDILLFLTGQDEIDYACEILENFRRLIPELVVLPIYSALQYSEQVKVFDSVPEGSRKLVISTNVAETSMTIPGIYYVIDSGYTKLNIYEPKSGLEVLQILPISQASADQRAGRAGRTGPGKCYRLYTKVSYEKMLKTTIPEIQRSNLASVVLQFKAMNIKDIATFEFLDPPSREVLIMSEKQLYMLEALDDLGNITDLGRRMVDLPLEPNLSKMLIISIDLRCSDEILTIIAMLSVQNIFYRPRKFQKRADEKKAALQSPISDLITLLNVYNTWKSNSFSSDWCKENFINERPLNEAYDVRGLLIEKMERNKFEIFSCGKNVERVQKAICAGLALNVARKHFKGYKYSTIQDEGEAYIHPSSGLMGRNPQWLVYHSLIETKKKYMRDVTIIDPEWLREFASSVYNFQ